jgi:hypothetical protein
MWWSDRAIASSKEAIFMSTGHLTRGADGHLTRSAARSPDSPSGDLTVRDALEAFLIAGRARGLSPKTLDWYRMIGERLAAYREAQQAPAALGTLTTAVPMRFVRIRSRYCWIHRQRWAYAGNVPARSHNVSRGTTVR